MTLCPLSTTGLWTVLLPRLRLVAGGWWRDREERQEHGEQPGAGRRLVSLHHKLGRCLVPSTPPPPRHSLLHLPPPRKVRQQRQPRQRRPPRPRGSRDLPSSCRASRQTTWEASWRVSCSTHQTSPSTQRPE